MCIELALTPGLDTRSGAVHALSLDAQLKSVLPLEVHQTLRDVATPAPRSQVPVLNTVWNTMVPRQAQKILYTGQRLYICVRMGRSHILPKRNIESPCLSCVRTCIQGSAVGTPEYPVCKVNWCAKCESNIISSVLAQLDTLSGLSKWSSPSWPY